MFRVRAMMGAAALAAVLAAPASAQNFNFSKLTYLTFSGPVQVPGATLPAGTYEFRLADPLSHRQVIQIRDRESAKVLAMLLSIPNRAAEARDEPYVMFVETPAGQPSAIKTWFYPGEQTGYEFVYPRDQAMRIASYSKEPVLSHSTDMKAESEMAAISESKVGRVNAQGEFAEDSSLDSGAASASAASAAQSSPAPSAAQSSTAASAATQDRAASSPASTNRPGSEAPASSSAQRDPATSQTEAGAPPRRQADAPDTMAARQLPRTASPLALVQLLGGGLIAAGFALRRRRKISDARG